MPQGKMYKESAGGFWKPTLALLRGGVGIEGTGPTGQWGYLRRASLGSNFATNLWSGQVGFLYLVA